MRDRSYLHTGGGHIGVAFVIEIVQQSNRAPKVGIRSAQSREMAHRGPNGVAVLAQALGLDPLVECIERSFGICFHGSSFSRTYYARHLNIVHNLRDRSSTILFICASLF